MLVLDTGAWLAWISAPARIPPRTQRAMLEEETRSGLVVSAISIWEVATKAALGKLALDRDTGEWLDLATSHPGITVLPVDPADAIEATRLPGDLPHDAADRMIVALARRLDCPLVTSDRTLRAYRHVKTLW